MDEFISEYEDYIAEETKNGKTLSEIFANLGTPRILARNLRRENARTLLKPSLWLRLAAFLLYFGCAIAYREILLQSVPVTSATFAVSLIALWFGIGGTLKSAPRYVPSCEHSPSFLRLHILTASVTGGLLAWNLYFIYRIQMGGGLLLILFGGAIAYLLLLFRSVTHFLYTDLRYFSSICHTAGGLFTVFLLFDRYWNLDRLEMLSQVPQAFALYVTGVLVGGAFFLLTRRTRENGTNRKDGMKGGMY